MIICMKAITIHVSEPLYESFQESAKTRGRSAAELIREAMEQYWKERICPQTSLRDWRPSSLGKVLRPLSAEDDLLGEMRGGR